MPPRIVAIGEVLWDLFPAGPQLGGTTANFTVHARGIGADAKLISRVGHDDLGRDVLTFFQSRGIETGTIQVDETHPTGSVAVSVSPEGQPSYRVAENVAWDYIAADAAARAAVAEADAICFGTLAQRSETSRRAIRELLASAKPGCLKVFDVNRRMPYWSDSVVLESLGLADVLKLNDDELEDLAGKERSEREVIAALVECYPVKLVALTRGSRGSVLYSRGEWSVHPGTPVKVKDAVGAGDAFAAVLTFGFLAGWPLDRINEKANAVAAYVCTQPGATPVLPKELLETLASGTA